MPILCSFFLAGTGGDTFHQACKVDYLQSLTTIKEASKENAELLPQQKGLALQVHNIIQLRAKKDASGACLKTHSPLSVQIHLSYLL